MDEKQAGALLAALEFHHKAAAGPARDFPMWAAQRDAMLKMAIGRDVSDLVRLAGRLEDAA